MSSALPLPSKSAQGGTPQQREQSRVIVGLSAVTLATHDMARALRFYLGLGFQMRYGGEQANFSSLDAGNVRLNLTTEGSHRQWSWWGRLIFYVSDVDAMHSHALACGLRPDSDPRDASWDERYFHITDPDGHELSFAVPLHSSPGAGSARPDTGAIQNDRNSRRL
jgi:catechol 2,3-dioxygenase-like lactoylglutathione lyase family enzyme